MCTHWDNHIEEGLIYEGIFTIAMVKVRKRKRLKMHVRATICHMSSVCGLKALMTLHCLERIYTERIYYQTLSK